MTKYMSEDFLLTTKAAKELYHRYAAKMPIIDYHCHLPPIAQYSPLLPPVGVWAVSQSQCGRSPSQVGYPSSTWWAVTSPTI